ncbi:MAG: TonB-dependent receptor [Acidobacteriota bacterium]
MSDPTGASVPNAAVEVSGPALIRAMKVNTDATGRYAFPSLPPGRHDLMVTATGFRQYKQSGIELMVGRLLTIDVKLEVGQLTESVVVSGEAVIVDTAQSTTAANVTQSFFDRLPKSRSFTSLIALAPGARSEAKSGGFQIDGSSGSENVWVIDGAEVTNLQTGVLPRQSEIPFELVQELQIKSSGFEAQYGGAMGGVINVVTRSGSNDLHGQVSLFLENDAMNAGPRPTLRINPLDDNIGEYFHNKEDGYRLFNPGASIGGPLKKDKAWFFLGWYPELRRTERTVTFLRDKSTSTFEQTTRDDYLMTRLDVAPTDKLRTNFGYIYSPYRRRGALPSRQGTDSPTSPWSQLGNRQPAFTSTFAADYSATAKLLISARGGYNYRNNKDYGIPRGTARFRYANSNTGLPALGLPIPANVLGPAGNFTTDNRQTVTDIQTRWRTNVDVSYLLNAGGQHNFRAGYEINRLHNDALAGTWPDGYIFVYWNSNRQGITMPGGRGRYGYYIDRFFATTGDVASNNTSIYFQDGWQVNRKLRLNLGLRMEREFLPSFKIAEGIPSRAIEFGFGKKLAPRLGFAYDVFGDSKLKVYGSFGLFYDMMKYEMPRGSFGGDVWTDLVFKLDDPDIFKIKPTVRRTMPADCKSAPGCIDYADWRIPSHDPSENLIDPDLMPVRNRVWDFGTEYALTPTLAFTTRYTRRQLDRTIEDTGILTEHGEVYYVANPGFGITADPKFWPKGFPVTPEAERVYDGIEFRIDKRYSRNYIFAASYTYSRLWGNYGGLASSDENGRVSPNVNRYFDLPFMSFDKNGKLVYGRLATDRPHTLKFFGSYTLRTKAGETMFSPNFYAYSGTPLTTEVQMVSSVPIFANGRGDLGRTPVYSNTDFLVGHDFKLAPAQERYRLRVEMNITNLFNQSTVVNKNVNYVHANDGQVNFDNEVDFFKGFDYMKMMKDQKLRVDPRFGLASEFQGPRSLRFGLHFFF